jgi:hypothetical protein
MKISLITGGLFIIIFICLIPLKRHIVEYDTQKNGQSIIVTITYVPNCFGSKIRHYLKFRYENKIYSKVIGKPCEEYRIGETLNLKHTKGTSIFLYENEKIETEFISFGLLTIFGLFCIIYGFKRK